ncbi:DsbA family protein [Streptomyces sp. NPDC060205]|uniref:DsbA family protein n=1 Tax=Streptomyces sp. NPDC060205 TaxID=3347072 RepID=UPI00365AA39C
MLSAERACLTYAFDAYCAWCYGFGPTVRALAEDNAHRTRLSAGVVSASLYTGARALPVAAYPHLPAERGTITRLTEADFGTRYDRAVSRGTTVLDSTHAAAGLAALREQPGSANWTRPKPCMGAWFVDSGSLSDVQVHPGITVELGLDADAVSAAYTSPSGRVRARADFRTLRRLRVTCASSAIRRCWTPRTVPTTWVAQPPPPPP